MTKPNFYAAGGLDRVGPLRKDADWVASRLGDDATRFVPVWRGLNLVRDTGDGPSPVLLDRHQAANLLAAEPLLALLGLDDGIAHFALDITATEPPALPDARFADLRAIGPLLAHRDGALFAYAKGLLYWHSRHRFCGLCGHATRPRDAGHVRVCSNPDCTTTHFPRTDPAVIMLVTDGDQCLLGRQAIWPAGMYSTLAGFVEPGESLEEAVAREVQEEAGIAVTGARYHSSQPWPFPASIMLGFHAAALSRDIRVDQAELEDARWFSRDWILRHVDDKSFRLPRKDSIARRLVEAWLGR